MEFFKWARVVRFRSHHNRYLLAGDDKVSVWQSPDGTVKNAQWTVEINEETNALRLKSCFGKYLTASSTPPGFLGILNRKKITQTLPNTLDSSVEWEPIKDGFKMRLKMAGHGQFLRANGGLPPWRNSITHDTAYRSAAKDWAAWDVDVVEMSCWEPSSATKFIKTTTSDNVEMSDDDCDYREPYTPSAFDYPTSSPPPAKRYSDNKKYYLGNCAYNLYYFFSGITMCSCSIAGGKQRSKGW